ncbi:DUF222 domain-containing protein [Corynebacterium sp. LK2510]|uniref:HNH endonuclease signature motif containing protein n=1 Tax=Corynebacterium sp. LK2510 TaxID=3110472 RepID=UPI0034CE27C1
MEKLAALNDAIENAFSEIRDLFSDPGNVTFADVHSEIERLEEITHMKAFIDAAFAFVCERDDAGRTVGARYASSYLTDKLGLSRGEAFNRLSRGRELFAEPAGDAGSGSDAGADEREKARQSERESQRKARSDSAKVSAEKQRIINHELRTLLPNAVPGRASLLADALREAATRSPEDLRRWVRRRVEQANACAPTPPKPKDPFGPYRNRSVRFGLQRTDGTCDITITAPAGEAALLKAILDAGLHPGSNLPEDAADSDSRTPGQRRFDQLMAALHHVNDCTHTPQGTGAASVVLSMTLDDLEGADHTTTFSTTTGIDITCYDILRLGLAGKDFVVQIDRVTGMPLSIGATRLANLAQRLALFAAQGVCAWEGCTTPFSELEIHHLIPYAAGGRTNIENLAGLCRQHHRCNNDNHDFSGGLNHTVRDPGTHRVGVAHPDGTVHYNSTSDAHNAPGYRLAHRRSRQHSPANDPPLFAPPG